MNNERLIQDVKQEGINFEDTQPESSNRVKGASDLQPPSPGVLMVAVEPETRSDRAVRASTRAFSDEEREICRTGRWEGTGGRGSHCPYGSGSSSSSRSSASSGSLPSSPRNKEGLIL